MYLKSLEIHGFKSFANKIVFEFHNGITGIVGPNGSGKSNVSDAVRWVLGEQSAKQLRGGNMQDVIFSGTENRKAQGFAHVSMTLDNSDHKLPIDYEEVTVTRRVYRSGESEYLINGTSCRLKDVNELFYDTGIGKEGYSIIGQGQIDKILSGKPEERRELFDEAAGIVKFKRRKNTAVKKLEDERQNLVRVNDILEELTKQVGPLKKQSEVAYLYLQKKEELKNLDVNMFLLEMTGIKGQLEELKGKYQITQDDLQETKKSFEDAKIEYERLEAVLEEIEHKITKTREESNHNILSRQQLEGQIQVLKEQINTSKLNDEHFQNRMDSIAKELESKKNQGQVFQKEEAQLKENHHTLLGKQEEVKEKLLQCQREIEENHKEVELFKAQIMEVLSQRSEMTGKMQRYDAMLEQLNIRKSSLSQKVLKMKSDESAYDETIAAYENEAHEMKEQIGILESKLQTDSISMGEIQKVMKEQGTLLENYRSSYHREFSRLESLKNITERYDGYGNSIRKVMEQKGKVSGIHGVVADLIQVEKSYEVAVETALGGSIQNIVTDSEQTAKKMIEYLKKNKFGRATFLPLTTVGQRGGFTNEKALQEEGVIGLASTLVKTQKEYFPLISYLLGRTIVVDHIDHGIALARKYHQSLRIVTLEGESLNPGGSMTGGAFRNTSNLLGRRREIESLEVEVSKLKKDMEDIQLEIQQKNKEQESFQQSITVLKEQLQKEYLRQNTIDLSIKQAEEKKEEAKIGYYDLHQENNQMEEELRDVISKKSETSKEVEGSIAKEQELNEQVGALGKVEEKLRMKEKTISKEVDEIQLEEASYRQKIEFSLSNASRIVKECEQLEEEKRQLSGNVGLAEKEIKEKEASIQKIEELIEEGTKQIQEQEEKIKKMMQEKDAFSSSHKSFFSKREELSKRISLLDKEEFRLSSQKEKLEEAQENRMNYMWQEYELTLNTVKQYQEDVKYELPELKKQIGRVKEEIRKLGDVNVNAIEDYKSVSERYEFLLAQHNDLIEAEGVLLKIIEELDTGMRIQFQEKFQEIQGEFDKVFKQLFGGGKGTLALDDEEDVLEAGISIVSQPPGKKLQNMMQLSGGEKALTAIALLFAIQNLKPSPFCLLDEIEAALDDSNVERYAAYLHKLTAHTQFIIITHRRGTMEAADRLYGITMQEKGVSTLVSVNLIEEELEK